MLCWGANGNGEVGVGSAAGALLPTELTTPPGLGAAGTARVRLASGAVRCWGDNLLGQCGADPTLASMPPDASKPGSLPLRGPARLGLLVRLRHPNRKPIDCLLGRQHFGLPGQRNADPVVHPHSRHADLACRDHRLGGPTSQDHQ
jgi:alpha-tubulin suppressor-like RCC1 family protein